MLQSIFNASKEAETIGCISGSLTNYGYNEEALLNPTAAINSMAKGNNVMNRLKANTKMNGGVASNADKLQFKDGMRDARNMLKNGNSSFKDGMKASRQLDHYQTQFNKKYDN